MEGGERKKGFPSLARFFARGVGLLFFFVVHCNGGGGCHVGEGYHLWCPANPSARRYLQVFFVGEEGGVMVVVTGGWRMNGVIDGWMA